MIEKSTLSERETPSERSTLSTEDRHHPKQQFDDAPHSGDERPKKKWWQRLNPFLAGETSPIPDDAGLVPELKANWWSKLTWGWMGPLMMVLCPAH